MTIPTLPAFFDMNYTNQSGKLTPDGYLYNDQMFQSLNLAVILLNGLINSAIINNNIVNNGVQFPQFTSTEITALQPAAANGTVWFNTTLAKLQVKTATGVIETITSV
ncbi:hypothetical protein UFOVP93_4 [uncultured Caudovirales phage]|uniref:Uncharacterized protein n=1 Tax=uncultured Caudovirales phage TaxID=2100421 RepID=A0A6J5L2X5_9CAUD|nr:hypothetical protein UFOVP93_4 [uncultured Caudovirales phage]